MLKILSASKTVIKNNLQLLAKDYKEKTGRVVCLTCPSDVSYMLSTLKTIYKMTAFSFKRDKAQYKNKKGDTTTISNNTMTDEKAIEFLKTDPKRISLFSKFPKNWKEVIKGTAKTKGQVQAEAQAEAATKAAEEAAELEAKGIDVNDATVIDPEEAAGGTDKKSLTDDCCEDEEKEPCEECLEKKRQELSKMTLANLRKAYTEVKDTSIKGFVEKVLTLKK